MRVAPEAALAVRREWTTTFTCPPSSGSQISWTSLAAFVAERDCSSSRARGREAQSLAMDRLSTWTSGKRSRGSPKMRRESS